MLDVAARKSARMDHTRRRLLDISTKKENNMPANSAPPVASTDFTESDLRTALTSFGSSASASVAKNPKLLKTTFDILKFIAKPDPIAGASTLASGVSASSKVAGASNSLQKGAKATAFGIGEFKATMDLVKVSKLTSLGAIGGFVGATVIQKTGMAVSLAGGDDERAQCVGAVMELAGALATTAIAGVPTGGVILVLTAASLSASSYSAYLTCFPSQ